MSTQTELILQRLLGQLTSQHAQELHLSVGEQPTIRKNGALQLTSDHGVVVEDFIIDIMKSLLVAEEQQALKQHKELVVSKEIGSLGRFKVHVYYQRGTIAITFIYINEHIPLLKELLLPLGVSDLVHATRGLIIVSGPYDSGRSTIVAAFLQEILTIRRIRVMTLEQPLEYLLSGKKGSVEQRHVGKDVESFEAGLELLHEEDVEVVFVSEITSLNAARQVVSLALADRLVIVTLTADSAVRAVEVFTSLDTQENHKHFVEDFSDALRTVMNVRLVPRQGQSGRVLATELLLSTPAMKLALREHDYTRMQNILQTSREDGMIVLDHALVDLVNKGVISLEDAQAVAHDPERLKGLLKK